MGYELLVRYLKHAKSYQPQIGLPKMKDNFGSMVHLSLKKQIPKRFEKKCFDSWHFKSVCFYINCVIVVSFQGEFV